MTVFFRLENPPGDYHDPTAGPSIPTDYGYVNKDPASPEGSGTTDRAFMNPAQPGGSPNEGTLFVAWTNEAASANVNRLGKALATNLDYLDNSLRRRMGSLVATGGIAIGGGDAYYEIAGVSVWCGSSGGDDPRDLVQILDANGDDVLKQTAGVNASFVASDLQPIGGGGSLIGTGWSASAGVRVVFNTTAAAATYYFRYTKLDSLHLMAAGSITKLNQRLRVGFGAKSAISYLKGPATAPATALSSPPVSNVADLAYGGLDARYRRGTTDAAYDVAKLDTPGEGARITRDGVAPESRSALTTGSVDGVRSVVDPVNAAWKADMRDAGQVGAGTAVLNKAVGSIGFASYGAHWGVRAFDDYAPSVAGFAHFRAHRDATRPAYAGATKLFTNIPAGCSADLEFLTSASVPYWVVTLNGTGTYPDAFFYKDIGAGVLRTAIVRKRDILELTFTDATANVVTRAFVILELYTDGGGLGLNNRKALVVPLDMGAAVNIGAGVHAATVVWHSTAFFVGDGAAGATIAMDGLSPPAGVSLTDMSWDGLFVADTPLESDNQSTSGDALYAPDAVTAAGTFGAHSGTRKALSVQAFDHDATVGRFVEKGYWRGDGVLAQTGALQRFQNLSAGASSWDITLGATASIESPTPSAGTTRAIDIVGLPTTGDFLGGEIVLAVTISAETPVNQIDLTASGLTMVFSDPADKTIPIGTSVYRGRQLGPVVLWSVVRY